MKKAYGELNLDMVFQQTTKVIVKQNALKCSKENPQQLKINLRFINLYNVICFIILNNYEVCC